MTALDPTASDIGQPEDRRLLLALQAAQLGTWQWDRQSGQVRWDARLEDLFGMAPGTFDGCFETWLRRVHPDDRASVLATVQEALDTGSDYRLEHRVVLPGGGVRWIEGRGAVTFDAAGRPSGTIGVAGDATERKQAEEEAGEHTELVENLHRIGTVLVSELDLDRLVQAVTDVSTAITGAQFGAFFYNTVDASGATYVLHTLSGAPPGAFSAFPMPRATELFGPTFRGEGVVRCDDVTTDPRYGHNPPYHGMPDGHLPVRSYLAAPVVSTSGEVLGGLFFGHADPAVFGEREERLLTGIAAQAAVALDNARLYKAAADTARTLQANLLPPALVAVPGLEVGVAYHPITGADSIGGDFYDLFQAGPGRFAAVVGDVCGKGVAAANLTALVRHTVRGASMAGAGAADTLAAVNRSVLDHEVGEQFCAATVLAVHPRERGVTVVLCCAGLPLPLCRRSDGSVHAVGAPGTPLGLFPETQLAEVSVDLAPGDTLFVFTDGFTEARSPDGRFAAGLMEWLATETAALPAQETADQVARAVLAFEGGRPRDDMALLVLRALPA